MLDAQYKLYDIHYTEFHLRHL